MHPGDRTLYLCCHGGLHAWFRAKWLGDLARAHSLGLLDWETSFNQARESGQERVLWVGLLLLQQVYGLPIPDVPGIAPMRRRSRLVDVPLKALKDPNEPQRRVGPAKLRNRIRIFRYERLLWPGKTWRTSLAELFYGREDFRTLPLPDRLFWVYTPLRPVLWMWRWVQQAGRRHVARP